MIGVSHRILVRPRQEFGKLALIQALKDQDVLFQDALPNLEQGVHGKNIAHRIPQHALIRLTPTR
jgi:hypothetical protein